MRHCSLLDGPCPPSSVGAGHPQGDCTCVFLTRTYEDHLLKEIAWNSMSQPRRRTEEVSPAYILSMWSRLLLCTGGQHHCPPQALHAVCCPGSSSHSSCPSSWLLLSPACMVLALRAWDALADLKELGLCPPYFLPGKGSVTQDWTQPSV